MHATIGDIDSARVKDAESHIPFLHLDFEPTFSVLASINNAPRIHSFEFTGLSLKNSLLTNCHGNSNASELLAVLGLSREAQTALMCTLAGRHHAVNSLLPGARIIANDSEELFSLLRSGYVLDEPVHIPTNTVEEEFWFACTLFLPIKLAIGVQASLVQDMIKSLNLVAKKRVRNLTKAELKRLAIGVELFSLPNLLVVDQPVTGDEDRNGDWQTVQVLKSLYKLNICQVVASFALPRREIFHEISQHVLLLGNTGETLSMGTVQQAEHVFTNQGFSNTTKLSQVAFLLLHAQYSNDTTFPLIRIGSSSTISANASTVATAVENKASLPPTVSGKLKAPSLRSPIQSLPVQFKCLAVREFRNVIRQPTAMLKRVIQVAFIMGLCTILFVGAGDQTLTKYMATIHFGSFVFPILSLCISGAISTFVSTRRCKRLMLREQAGSNPGYYSILALFFSVLSECVLTFIIMLEAAIILKYPIGWGGDFILFVVAFFVMIESTVSYVTCAVFAFESAAPAAAATVVIIVPQILYLGTFIRMNAMPEWMSKFAYVCNMAYSAKVLGVLEFGPERCTTPTVCAQHEAILDSNFTYPEDLAFDYGMLLMFFVVYRALALAFYYRALAKRR